MLDSRFQLPVATFWPSFYLATTIRWAINQMPQTKVKCASNYKLKARQQNEKGVQKCERGELATLRGDLMKSPNRKNKIDII